ncbi:hypothetical protein HFO89_31740 [Rhizobium leguminosarum]|nr:hypothetical protein [Rhizobium leguminosarum]
MAIVRTLCPRLISSPDKTPPTRPVAPDTKISMVFIPAGLSASDHIVRCGGMIVVDWASAVSPIFHDPSLAIAGLFESDSFNT